MITLTITAETADEFRFQFSGVSALVAGGITPAHVAADTKAPVSATPRTRKPTETVTPPEPEKQAEEDDQSPPEIDGEGDTSVATLEQIRAKATEVSQAGKQPEVKALLLKFEAKSVSTIPEDKRSAFLKALEAL